MAGYLDLAPAYIFSIQASRNRVNSLSSRHALVLSKVTIWSSCGQPEAKTR